ncbi:MAG: amidohydrolase [Bacteroidetes bacterium]|nr:amidohydrolase [Bacteroidota bacterium]
MVRYILAALLLCTSLAPCLAGSEIPGRAQEKPIALVKATVHTVSGGTLTNASVVFDKGRIVSVGTTVEIPAGAEVIDCSGKHVYPGFIAPMAGTGLVEIDAIRATRDIVEVGSFNPNVRAEVAYNPDSEIIPTIRYNGILLANVSPQGGTISGMSSVMRMDGWTREDIAVRPTSALVVNWPQMDVVNAPWMTKSADEQRKEIDKNVREVIDYLLAARAYSVAARAGVDSTKRDIRFEAMRAVFEKGLPLMVACASQRQIESVLDMQRQLGLTVILVGAQDAPRCLTQIKRAGVPIVIGRVHGLPRREEDGYDATYTLPALLSAQGIPFAYSEGGHWQQRNLPFNAGSSIAFGCAELDAEKGLTLWPAQMLGIDSTYGSLEVGKSATLFVSTGNALDARTNILTHAYIDGRAVDLSNRHTKLTTKYRARSKQ